MIVGHAKAVHGRVQYSKIRATILQYNFKKQTMPNMVEKKIRTLRQIQKKISKTSRLLRGNRKQLANFLICYYGQKSHIETEAKRNIGRPYLGKIVDRLLFICMQDRKMPGGDFTKTTERQN